MSLYATFDALNVDFLFPLVRLQLQSKLFTRLSLVIPFYVGIAHKCHMIILIKVGQPYMALGNNFVSIECPNEMLC